MSASKAPKQRLRKQPRMRRVQSATALPLPEMAVPKTAKKRKRRNSHQRFRGPLSTVQSVVFSSRWLSLGLLAVCAYALYLIGGNEQFYLNFVPVEGTGTVSANDIVEKSGLAGHHVFAADPQEAANRILEMPGVISATVTLRWPNDVLIQVREDPPLAIWEEGGQQFWVGKNGELTLARTETVGLLKIVSEMEAMVVRDDIASELADEDKEQARTIGAAAQDEEAVADDGSSENTGAANETTADEPSAGESDQGSDAAFVPETVMQGALQLRELRPNIDQLYYRPSGGLSYQDGRGWRAYFGTGRDMHQKLVVYETVVADLLAKGLTPEYISVSNQEKPFYRIR